MDRDSVRGVGRRRVLGWGGVGAVGAVMGGGGAARAEGEAIPDGARPGGAYDRYVARLAAEDKFSGVVLLSYRGRTVLSRSYGMADQERGIRNHEGVAFNLSSAGKPFGPVALLQLVERGEVRLWETVGRYLTGFPPEIADKVTIHHLLTGTSGLESPPEDLARIFRSREEVREFYGQWARRAKAVAAPGTPTHHAGVEVVVPAQIVEAVTGMTYWDYVQENIFARCGMTGTGFYTRPQWLTDEHIAHSYMRQADGTRVDAVRNLDKGSPDPFHPGKNPGRSFVDQPGDGGFATAPDLVRFARALTEEGTVLSRPYAELATAPQRPKPPQGGGFAARTGPAPVPADAAFGSYTMPVGLVGGAWLKGRAGANPGSVASWNVYPDSGWVGVILANHDDVPFRELIEQEIRAVTGRP